MSSPTVPSQVVWRAACLTMHNACEEGGFEDAQHIITFLNYHLESALEGSWKHDEPIQDAFCALAHTSDTITAEALRQFDPTIPWFVCGISYTFQDAKPLKLREAALLFLPLISDRWFNSRFPIMDPIQMSNFFMNWASAVEDVEKTPAVQKAALSVLFGMVNSPHWRPYIVPEKWMLLRSLMSVPDDLQPLCRYLNNSELMEEIKKVDNPMALVLWVEILWLKYTQLSPKMQIRLEVITKEIAQNEKEAGLDLSQSNVNQYLTNTTLELGKVEDALKPYTIGSTEPIAIALREKAGNLQQALRALNAIRPGSAL